MSVFSNGSIKTMYIDPVSFVPNGRCAFELDASKAMYLPNMRLLNVGCFNGTGVVPYSLGVGASAVIRNISLLDARTELSAQRNITPLSFFKNLNRSNNINKSNDSWLKRNRLGFEVNGINNKITSVYNRGSSGDSEAQSDTAYLDLREVLPLLNEIPALPTSVFSNLRIEVEFQKQAQQILGNTSYNLTVMRPVLAVDYVDNEALVPALMEQLTNGVEWKEIEWDNFIVPAVDTSGYQPADVKTQAVQNQSLAFLGKTVDRLLITKQVVDIGLEANGDLVLGYGGVASSQAVLNQTTQVRLNGKNVWGTFNGITGTNEMLGTVVDAYGEMQTYPGSTNYLWNQADDLNGDEASPPAGYDETSGQASFACCELGARVANLQIALSRTNNRDAGDKATTNVALQVNLYAEVHKVITFNNGSYSVIYA